MKILYSLAALLTLGSLLPAAAQRAPLPATRPLPLTHDDSLAVLHQLFRHERRGGREGTVADAVVLPLNVVALVSKQGTDFQRGLQFANVTVFAPLLVTSIMRWARYGKRREREAVERFEQRLMQPVYLQRSYALALIERSNKR